MFSPAVMPPHVSIIVFSRSFSARAWYRLPQTLPRKQASLEVAVQGYRKAASHCAARAEGSLNPFTRKAFRELSVAWLMLHRGAEQLAKRSIMAPCALRAERKSSSEGHQ